MKSTLEVKEISKSFGQTSVLADVSFSLLEGEFSLLLGANGSGKTTLLRLCAGLARADSGEVLLENNHHRRPSPKVSYLAHKPGLYRDLTVEENIELFCSLFGSAQTTSELINYWNLNAHRLKRVSELSSGLLTRVALARTFLGPAKLLLLDEPTASIDEQTTALLMEKVFEFIEEPHSGSVVMATHDLARAAESAQRALVLDSGRVGFDTRESDALVEDALLYYRRINR